jgi:hypothetical protein
MKKNTNIYVYIIYYYQFLSILINYYQLLSIIINYYQLLSIIINYYPYENYGNWILNLFTREKKKSNMNSALWS